MAWLCANGALLDVVQVFAWGRMFAGYARVLSLGEAVSRTFDPGKPCELCLAVRKARAAAKGRRRDPMETTKSSGLQKMLLAREGTEPVRIAPPAAVWEMCDRIGRPGPVRAVPVPPPRSIGALVLS
jgi:hypothetical protein